MEWTRRDGRIVRPRIYPLARGYGNWRWIRDQHGWWWIGLGYWEFTTHP